MRGAGEEGRGAMGECPYGWGRRKVCKSFTHPSIHPPTHPPILPIGIGEALLVNNIGSSRARTLINRSFFRLQYMMRSTPPLQVGVGGWVGGWVGGEAPPFCFGGRWRRDVEGKKESMYVWKNGEEES